MQFYRILFKAFFGLNCELSNITTAAPPTTAGPTTDQTEQVTTEPATTEPQTTEPATTEPATTEPATTEPATTEPATTEIDTTTEAMTTAEVTLPECFPRDDCSGHYTCDNETNAQICLDGYTGDDCRERDFVYNNVDLDPECPPSLATRGCLNGGACFDGQCCCDSGFEGDACETAVLACLINNPCQNGATCLNEPNGELRCLCFERMYIYLLLLLRCCCYPSPPPAPHHSYLPHHALAFN